MSNSETTPPPKRKFTQVVRNPKKHYVTVCVPVEIQKPRECLKVILELEDVEQQKSVCWWGDDYGKEIQDAIDEAYGKDVYAIDDVVELYDNTKDSEFGKYPIAICPKPNDE